MVRQRRQSKKKKTRRLISDSQHEAKFSRNKTQSRNGKLTKNTQIYNHPYATRSKTSNNSTSPTIINKLKIKGKKKELSENSVIFLGAFRKIPQLIDLEDAVETTPTTKSSTDLASRYPYQQLYDRIDFENWFKIKRIDS